MTDTSSCTSRTVCTLLLTLPRLTIHAWFILVHGDMSFVKKPRMEAGPMQQPPDIAGGPPQPYGGGYPPACMPPIPLLQSGPGAPPEYPPQYPYGGYHYPNGVRCHYCLLIFRAYRMADLCAVGSTTALRWRTTAKCTVRAAAGGRPVGLLVRSDARVQRRHRLRLSAIAVNRRCRAPAARVG